MPFGCAPADFKWSHYYAIDFTCVESPAHGQTGVVATWGNDTKGLLSALRNVDCDYRKRERSWGVDVPGCDYDVCRIGGRISTLKEIYDPKFTVVEWMTAGSGARSARKRNDYRGEQYSGSGR